MWMKTIGIRTVELSIPVELARGRHMGEFEIRRVMFLRRTRRRKDGKTHSYWSVVENQRVQGGRVMQRHVLYLGEISPSQAAAWRKSIEIFDEDAGRPRTLALFPEDRCAAVTPDSSTVQLRLSEIRLCRPRQWGACWLAGQFWEELQLDRFWSERLPVNRKGTRWDQVLQVLVSYQLIGFCRKPGFLLEFANHIPLISLN